MAIKGIEFLGAIDGKEYYLDQRPEVEGEKGEIVPNPSLNTVVWRVPDIREAVIAEKGYVILSADYSQIEVKLMAHLSRDPVLIAAINSGKDIHSFNAAEVFGAERHFDYDIIAAAKKDKNHPRHAELVKIRNDIKTVTFGVPYGAGANKVSLMTGMTKEESQAFIDAFFAKFRALETWLKKSGDDAIKYGFSRSPRGRRRFYELPSINAKEKEKSKIFSQVRRYAGNHPIQAGNVDMLKPAMWQIYNDIRQQGLDKKGSRVLFCVHDEIVTTSLEEDQDKIRSIMMYRMQESYDGIIPDIVNKIDVAVGPAWEKA